MLRKGNGGLYKAPTKEERRKREAKGRGDGDPIKFIDLRFERWQVIELSELCWGKAMVAYTKPQQWRKENSERLRGEEMEIRSSLLIVELSELCWGKAMVAYTKPQQRKTEESERLRGDRDQIKGS